MNYMWKKSEKTGKKTGVSKSSRVVVSRASMVMESSAKKVQKIWLSRYKKWCREKFLGVSTGKIQSIYAFLPSFSALAFSSRGI